MSSESTETPRLIPVMNGSACAGFLISLGPRGVEAFDKDEKPLGVFPDAASAATTVKKSVAPDAAKALLPAHSEFGGSIARRILNCPGSVRRAAKVPEKLRRSSADAERGTVLHAAMTLLTDEKETLESLVGKTINGYAITSDDVENALRPVFTYVTALLETPGAEYFSEKRVNFPTVAGAYGTADLLVRVGSTGHTVDYKFGRAVRVPVLYPDGDEDVINAQSLFYTASARYSEPKFFAGVDTFVLTILQPQSIEPDAAMVSSVEVTHDDLDTFIVAFRSVCEEALSEAPRLARGDWCRFCPAKPVCPLHTAPLLDLAQFVMPAPPAPVDKEAYLRALARGLDLVDATKDARTALHDQAKRALEDGDQVPGYTLSAGRAEHHWRDDEPAAIAALQSLGLRRDDILAEAMRSVKQIEIRAKARGLKVPQELIASQRSGVSLVRCENVRVPVRRRDELAQSFAAELEAFQKGRSHDYKRP